MNKKSENDSGTEGTKTWYRVTLGTVCCGFSVVRGHIYDVPPILRGFYRKPLSTVERWIDRNGGKVEKLKDL